MLFRAYNKTVNIEKYKITWLSDVLNSLQCYIIAVAIPFIFLNLAYFFQHDLTQNFAILLFLAGIVISSFIGGYVCGIITTFVSTTLIIVFSNPTLHLPGQGLRMFSLILFAIEGIVVSLIITTKSNSEQIRYHKDKEKKLKKRIETLEIDIEHGKKEIRSRDEFLSIASHELKTPLTSMLLQTQHALHNIRNVSMANFSIESLLKMLENVEHQTKRLSKMINDLLNVSLMTTGNLHLEYEEVHLNTVVAQVLDEFSPRLEREHYTVRLTEKDELIGMFDKVRIEQAISNLISNAIKYGEQKPIEVILRKHEHNAQIFVVDHGIGIPKEKQKQIFELFERAAESEKFKGLGVGLYITQQIVKAHDGILDVRSQPGKSTTFLLQLPLNPSQYEKKIKQVS